MQEFLKNVRLFFVRQFTRLGRPAALFSRVGPAVLVLGVGLVALVMGGMFVFGQSAFGLQLDSGTNGGGSGGHGDEAAEVIPTDSIASISKLDSDNDGLRDLDEVRYRTDAKNPDTDGDGFSDGEEVEKGFNPNSLPGARPEDDKLSALGAQGSSGEGGADTSFLELLGYQPVDSKVDGLNVGGLGGLPPEDLAKAESQILPSGERLGELEFDKLLSTTSQPLPTVNTGSIKVTNATDAAAKEKYYQEAAGIIVRFNPFPRGYNIEVLLNDIQHFNRDQLEKIKLAQESIYRELSKLSVPQPMVGVQSHALAILQAIQQTVDRILASNGSPDDTLYATGRTIYMLGEIGALLKTLVAAIK